MTTAALRFARPLPGLGQATSFHLAPLGQGLYKLTSQSLRLFAVDPAHYAPGYAPAVPTGDLDLLNLGEDEDPLVLLVAHTNGGKVNLNRTAPILINPATGTAIQAICN